MKKRKLTKHHLRARSRGGSKRDGILMLSWEKHCAWHKLFGNRTLDEIIAILQRIKRVKKGGKLAHVPRYESELGALVGVDSPF